MRVKALSASLDVVAHELAAVDAAWAADALPAPQELAVLVQNSTSETISPLSSDEESGAENGVCDFIYFRLIDE